MTEKKTAKTAFIYITALIGAGFATGKELCVYFFSKSVISGICGVLISALLFGISAYKTLLISKEYRIKSYKGLLYFLFGRPLGNGIYFFSELFFIVIFSSMSAAFGELCGILGLMRPAGSLIFCLLCAFILHFGPKGLSFISCILCPVMVTGCYVIGIKYFPKNIFDGANFDIACLPNALIYTSYNILTASAVLFCCQDLGKKQIKTASAIIFIIVLTASISLGCAVVGCKAVLPVYSLIKGSRIFTLIYCIILFCALLTTALSNAVCLKAAVPVPLICALGFCLSLVGFSGIVSKIYFLFGIIGSGLLAGILFCPLKKD